MCVHVYIINTTIKIHTHTHTRRRPYKTQQQQEEISSFTHTRTRNNNNFIILMMVVSKNNDKKFHQPTHHTRALTCHSFPSLELKNYNERTNDTNPICLLISQNDSMCAQISLMESLKVPERQWTCSIQVQGIRSQRFISRPRTTSTYVIFVRASL